MTFFNIIIISYRKWTVSSFFSKMLQLKQDVDKLLEISL